jgi:hypothetical protein
MKRRTFAQLLVAASIAAFIPALEGEAKNGLQKIQQEPEQGAGENIAATEAGDSQGNTAAEKVSDRPDEYDQFISRVRDGIIRLERREDRALSRLEIRAPHQVGGRTFRRVYVWFERVEQPVCWDERYEN